MLMPEDYGRSALECEMTRELMRKIEFRHDPAYDASYPDGIPTSVTIETGSAGVMFDSGFVMHPGGHARCDGLDVDRILKQKAFAFASLGVEGGDEEVERVLSRLRGIEDLAPEEMCRLYDFRLKDGLAIDE